MKGSPKWPSSLEVGCWASSGRHQRQLKVLPGILHAMLDTATPSNWWQMRESLPLTDTTGDHPNSFSWMWSVRAIPRWHTFVCPPRSLSRTKVRPINSSIQCTFVLYKWLDIATASHCSQRKEGSWTLALLEAKIVQQVVMVDSAEEEALRARSRKKSSSWRINLFFIVQ